MSEDEELDFLKREKGSGGGNQRVFGCPCGKTYLSYPALFTHVKQKHGGTPPGDLIKPKTDKARGRPKIHIDIPDDDLSDGGFNFDEQIEKAVENIKIEYNKPYEPSDGNKTCQDMGTIFLNKIPNIDDKGKKVVKCFLNELRFNVEQSFGSKYWVEERPGEIIDIANDLCHKHEENMNRFPISKATLIELMHILFRWMYKNKWTDHKLIRRALSRNL